MQSVILCWEASGRIWGRDDHACLLSALSPQLEILVALVLRSMQGLCPENTMHRADVGCARRACGITCLLFCRERASWVISARDDIHSGARSSIDLHGHPY